MLFSSILERYENLIHNRGKIPLQEAIAVARKINKDRQKLQLDLQMENDKQIEQLARERVVEFVNNNDPNDDFFSRIEAIRSQTRVELTERFKNMCFQ